MQSDGLPSQEAHYDAGPSIYDSTAAPGKQVSTQPCNL